MCWKGSKHTKLQNIATENKLNIVEVTALSDYGSAVMLAKTLYILFFRHRIGRVLNYELQLECVVRNSYEFAQKNTHGYQTTIYVLQLSTCPGITKWRFFFNV